MVTDIQASATECFDLSCSIDTHVSSMGASQERAVAGVTTGLIGLGEEVTWEAKHFGLRWRATSRITEFDRPRRFVDEMRSGPFRSFRHEHRFEGAGVGVTRMVDVVDYAMPLGVLGVIADELIVGRHLRRLIEDRNTYIKQAAENGAD